MDQIYLGITPYGENTDFEFVGRNEETWALYDRIARNDYTVYYAASGEGKSSLIRAGLIPILRRRDYFPVYIVFDDKEFDNPLSLERVLLDRIKNEDIRYEQSDWSKSLFNAEQSEALKSSLWWRIRNYCFKRGEKELKPLFIFDQFEEVFTKASYEWTDSFFSQLEEISTDYVPQTILSSWGSINISTQKNFKALFSFRTEYLGDLDYWCVEKHFLPSLQENRMCLKPLTIKGAKEVVALNESSLGRYSERIIKGCTEPKSSILSDNQPCVYALILSVVCQTLSDLPDNERDSVLNNLIYNQDGTIDDILLRFYRKKLKEVNLDYFKDGITIDKIEKNLVDEKGKRSRRDTDESSMREISDWIEPLCKNGLLKTIGKKVINGITVKTVELPHDRLCKAIDTSRKERHERVEWRLNRQGEWIQFGIITVIVGIIAFLWNSLIPKLNVLVYGFLKSPQKVWGEYCTFLSGKHAEYDSYSLDEGFSTISLMILLLLFIPLITTLITSKSRKRQIPVFALSLIGTLSLCWLLIRNNSIKFTTNYVYIFTVISFLFCCSALVLSAIKLRSVYLNRNKIEEKESISIWPLSGGYFLFGCYAFCEFLFRTSFGINEPCDSSWALLVLPMLFLIWAWGYFCMTIKTGRKKLLWIYEIVSLFILLSLTTISYIPYNNIFKNRYGFLISVVLIVVWLVCSILILCQVKSNTKFFKLMATNRMLIALMGVIIITATFIMNLGYNPLAISPSSVSHVSSWRDILISQKDSLGNKKMSIVYSSDGKTIIPFCILSDTETDILLSKGMNPFNNGRIPITVRSEGFSIADDFTSNADNSFVRNNVGTITGNIPVSSTLEEYLHNIARPVAPDNRNLGGLIDYYSASLFTEIRKANIDYLLTGVSYDVGTLKSLKTLDSLQREALGLELEKLSVNAKDTMITSKGWYMVRDRVLVLEDNHLVDFHRELTRSFILCLIKDRVNCSDIPSLFTLANFFQLVFFANVPAMDIKSNFNVHQLFTYSIIDGNDTINQTDQREVSYCVHSDDILNSRVFAWYDLFHCLCWMDIGCNMKEYALRLSDYLDNLSEYITVLKDSEKDLKNALDILEKPLAEFLKETLSMYDSIPSPTLFKDKFEEYIRVKKPEYYESILERLTSIDLQFNNAEIDESLQQLKADVLQSLLPIMKTSQTGIYNNVFESVCKSLILVSACRGNDVKDDLNVFSDYLNDKNNFYHIVEKISNDIGRLSYTQEDKTKFENQLKSIIENCY